MLRHLRPLALTLFILLTLIPAYPSAAQEVAQETVENPLAPASQTLPLPLTGVTQISAGGIHTCAVMNDGSVKCWGGNSSGQLGNGDAPTDSLVPVTVSGLNQKVRTISAGNAFTCALTTGGGVHCWGNNVYGQLGNDDAPNNSDTPVGVVGLGSGIVAITTGDDHACALTSAGGVRCWGNNANGQLGNSSAPTASDTPVNVTDLGNNVAAVDAGRTHTCAITKQGALKCWGDNSFSQLGDGNTGAGGSTPVDVVGLGSGVLTVAAGPLHTCAIANLTAQSTPALCWGDNFDGQLGDDNAPTDSPVPVEVTESNHVMRALVTGVTHTCALTVVGGVQCWGDNFNGKLGDGNVPTDNELPHDVIGLTGGVVALSGTAFHTCALLANSTVRCWGSGGDGRLGDGGSFSHSVPTEVLAPTVCYKLTRNKSGSGAAPAADPANSPGCPADHYLLGQIVTLLADSTAGFRVNGWAGTANNGALSEVNYLTMPAADRSISVTYAKCHALTRSHSGAGGNPVAAPDRSVNCPENTYVSGETVTLIAKPNPDQRVKTWNGADTNPFTGALVNSLTMPDADRTVRTIYEACFALAAVVAGQGEPITAVPASSTGCAASAYVAGESITLAAAPAAGWGIQGWSGTADNGSTGNTNVVTMPAANHSVGVTYVEESVPSGPPDLFLPALRR